MITSLAVILLLFCLITYHKMLSGVAFARKADDYLSSLVEETPEKLGNDLILMASLVNRDLPPVRMVSNWEHSLTTQILLAILANFILLFLTPIQTPVGALAWTLTIVGTFFVIIFNMNVGLIYINMKRNMWLISNLCNAYYDYKPPTIKHIQKSSLESIDDIIEKSGFTTIDEENNKKSTDPLDGKNDEHE